MLEVDGSAAREVAALNTRSAKAEPPLPELLADFAKQAAAIGLTPQTVAAMREPMPAAVNAPMPSTSTANHASTAPAASATADMSAHRLANAGCVNKRPAPTVRD